MHAHPNLQLYLAAFQFSYYNNKMTSYLKQTPVYMTRYLQHDYLW